MGVELALHDHLHSTSMKRGGDALVLGWAKPCRAFKSAAMLSLPMRGSCFMKYQSLGLSVGILLTLVTWGWADVPKGYVIVSSSETLSGERSCYENCENDDQCLAMNAGRCVMLNNVGSVCMDMI